MCKTFHFYCILRFRFVIFRKKHTIQIMIYYKLHIFQHSAMHNGVELKIRLKNQLIKILQKLVPANTALLITIMFTKSLCCPTCREEWS